MTAEKIKTLFSPENYRGKMVDLVHLESILRVAQGEKPADQAEVRQAQAIISRINQLVHAGVNIRLIDNPSEFTKPSNGEKIVLGGAFVGQRLADYQNSAAKHRVKLTPDPLLTLASV